MREVSEFSLAPWDVEWIRMNFDPVDPEEIDVVPEPTYWNDERDDPELAAAQVQYLVWEGGL